MGPFSCLVIMSHSPGVASAFTVFLLLVTSLVEMPGVLAKPLCSSSSPLRFGLGAATKAPARLVQAYDSVLKRHPLASNFVTGGVVMGLGDVACQRLMEHRGGGGFGEDVDWRRTANAALVGCLWSGYCSPQIYILAEVGQSVGQSERRAGRQKGR